MKVARHLGVALALGALLVVGALASSALAQSERTASELGQAVGEPSEQGGGTALYARTPTELEQRTSPGQGVTSTSSDGFDWGDAAIGAATALGLGALAGLGGMALLSRRRRAHGAVDVPVAAS
jgi:hypothetical protein